MEFFLVYIREAHPVDAKPGTAGRPGNPARGAPDIKQAKTIDDRVIAATECVKNMKLSIPVIIDDMAGSAEKAYGGWPDRFLVIDIDGKVAYQSGPGPAGFKPALGEQAIKAILANGGKWAPGIVPETPPQADPQMPGPQRQPGNAAAGAGTRTQTRR